MPRPKGSKNKAKVAIPANDFDTLIAEKSSTKEALEQHPRGQVPLRLP